jgi:DNA-binding GntR family transcriptional regulator
VDASETEELSRQRDALIGQGVQAYQQLQDEFDHELFGRRDLEVLASLMEQKNLLRQRLASYGVQVRA